MDFIRATTRIRAKLANPMRSIHPNPGEGIASKASFGPRPISAENLHGILRIAGHDRKSQPIYGEGKRRIHGTYRTPIRNPVVSPPCYQDGGGSAPRLSLPALGADRLCLSMMKRVALFSASFLCRSSELLPHDGKSFLTDFSRNNLDRLGLPVHHHAHQDPPRTYLETVRAFLCRASLDELAFLFRDLELQGFGFGIVYFHVNHFVLS